MPTILSVMLILIKMWLDFWLQYCFTVLWHHLSNFKNLTLAHQPCSWASHSTWPTKSCLHLVQYDKLWTMADANLLIAITANRSTKYLPNYRSTKPCTYPSCSLYEWRTWFPTYPSWWMDHNTNNTVFILWLSCMWPNKLAYLIDQLT